MKTNPTRILYVEDDPALRGILGTLLGNRPEIEVVCSCANSTDALGFAETHPVDAALLDLNLGADSLNGIDLGVALRSLHPDIGVVVMTQHQVPEFLTRLEPTQRRGWSFLLKRADISPGYLADVITSSARGLNIVDPTMLDRSGDGAAERLSPRQRQAMSLISQGLDAVTIAERLEIKPAAARQELSRAYSVLVPEPPAGADIRTLAVLAWLRETRGTAHS